MLDAVSDIPRKADHVTDGDYEPRAGLKFYFAETDAYREDDEPDVGLSGGWWVKVRMIGAMLTNENGDDVLILTREQVLDLIGADEVRDEERAAGNRIADERDESF